jgi:hypothetical protein
MRTSLDHSRLSRVTLVGAAASAAAVGLAELGLGWWGFVVAAGLTAPFAGLFVDLRSKRRAPSQAEAEKVERVKHGRLVFIAFAMTVVALGAGVVLLVLGYISDIALGGVVIVAVAVFAKLEHSVVLERRHGS